ncbi:hypothetical protein, variant [Aphanomyces astaci]|uniref:Transcription factor IIIC putative zinc-finger domain-containing protein n=1 Tax=Aphanomyces astaci TaxID=112090 RepID=W4FK08_APHAT|nr:hypothetical protein, variant [Aphanomyces astaci]ETV67825.1 hypothetical protein, variant [Aphanomyces astaci]|eukprot:XP_009842683.1 hypothetical protein, variant [Aphanomyces astaci]
MSFSCGHLPVGSAPNMSCAIATLTSSGQVGVYYPSTLDLQWKEVVSVSSLLKRHVAANSWSHVTAAIEAHNATDLLFTVPLPRFPQQQKNKASINAAFDAKRQKLSASFVDKVELQSVTTLAWSTATYDPTTGASMSYVALCGKRLSTVWRYEHNYAGTDGLFTSRLDESPVATAVTGVYGWPTCSAWMLMETDAIVVGTSSGNVLMMRLTRQEGSGGRMALEVERVLRTPQLQPVYALHYSLSRVCVAAGNTITVWPIGGDEGAPLTWQAHSHNISCLDVDHCDDHVLFSSSSDGCVKCWDVRTGDAIPIDYLPANNYPIYGMALSPNSVQLAVGYVCPPAAKPSRITQADTTYARLSSGLEFFAAPNARNATLLANSLEAHSSIDSLGDILSYCHAELSTFHAKRAEDGGSVWSAADAKASNDDNDLGQPLYHSFCSILEAKYTDQCQAAALSSDPPPPPMYLQVAYQVVVNMPGTSSAKEADAARLQQRIMAYWCDSVLRCRASTTVHQSRRHTGKAALSTLLMADFLGLVSISPANPHLAALVTSVYATYGTAGDKKRSVAEARPEDLPVRETCGLCAAPVPLTARVLEPVCDNGHALERCFRTLVVIDSAAAVLWKCMVCEAFATGRDKDDNDDDGNGQPQLPVLVCRLCGSYCQRIEY